TVIHTFPNVSQFWTYRPEEYLKNPVYSRDYPPCTRCSRPGEPSGGRGGSATRAARRVCEPDRAALMATVGVVGLGLLGGAVAARLRAGGHVVVGYDVVAEKVQALVELGGRAAPTADAVAKAAEAVCVVLPSLASVDEVVLGPRGLVALSPPGRTIIQMSTISPALTERLAREVRSEEHTSELQSRAQSRMPSSA